MTCLDPWLRSGSWAAVPYPVYTSPSILKRPQTLRRKPLKTPQSVEVLFCWGFCKQIFVYFCEDYGQLNFGMELHRNLREVVKGYPLLLLAKVGFSCGATQPFFDL